MTDQVTGAYGNVQIHVTRGTGSGGQYVLVYDLDEGDPDNKHCVYICGVSRSDSTKLSCVNSWGTCEYENPKYPQNISKISPKYPQNIAKISPKYPQNILKISPKYPQNILKISPKYPQHIPKISLKYPQNIPKISQKYL